MSTLIEAMEVQSDDRLTPLQHQVLSHLASGQSVAATARACGLHRSTIYHWQHENPDFARSLRDAKHERNNHWHAVVDEHAAPAFAFIRATMDNEQAPLSQRLRAAFFLATQSLKPAPAPGKYELQHEQAHRAQLTREQPNDGRNADRDEEYEANFNEDDNYEDGIDPADPTHSDTSATDDVSDHSVDPTDPTQFDTPPHDTLSPIPDFLDELLSTPNLPDEVLAALALVLTQRGPKAPDR